MKILTKEEEDEHYRAVLRGGIGGGLIGLGLGLGATVLLHKRWPFFRQLTLPLKTFFVTSSGTAFAIIRADSYSRAFEAERNGLRQFEDETQRALAEAQAQLSAWERAKTWGREHRYTIVTASWAASMGASLGIVSRNRYLTTAQKLVQARMYAQGLTLLVLVATAAFEVADARTGKGGEEVIKMLDPNDPEHKRVIERKVHHESYAGEDLWKDMVASEERRQAARREAAEVKRRA